MLIIIYLGNMGWKWTGDELQASEFSWWRRSFRLEQLIFSNM